MEKYKEYDGVTPLEENEYLLKMRLQYGYDSYLTGFMTKLTKKGELPVAFKNWGDEGIYVINETYRFGWEIISWRIGLSQSWARVKHPDGFTLEVYLHDLLGVIKNNTVINGAIQGEFLWQGNKLIKKP